MRVKLVNGTEWHGPDLRAIVTAACRAAGMVGDPRVFVAHTGRRAHKARTEDAATVLRSRVRGWAWVRSHAKPGTIKILVPRPDQVADDLRQLFKRHVAQVAHHEALHSVGAHHRDMTEEQLWCRQAVPWAEKLPLRTKLEARPKESQPPEQLKLAAFREKILHVREMHKRAVTRRKRAETIEKKWARRLKMLEKRST